MIQIETGPNGQVWAVNSNGDFYVRLGIKSSSPSGLSWQKIGNKKFKSVTVGLNRIFAVDLNGVAYMGSITSDGMQAFYNCL